MPTYLPVFTQRLKEESARLGTALETVKAVAEQTHRLVFGRVQDTAYASEARLGFAEVADDVYGLVLRTQGAAAEIEVLLDELRRIADEVSRHLPVKQGVEIEAEIERLSALLRETRQMTRRVAEVVARRDDVAGLRGGEELVALREAISRPKP